MIRFVQEITKEVRECDGKIVECQFVGDPITGHWQIMRIRTDKSLPNAFATAQSERFLLHCS